MSPAPEGMVVRRLGPDDVQTYRAVRLEMLRDSPDAFGTSYAEACRLTPQQWRERLVGLVTLHAEVHGEAVGSVTLAGGSAAGAGDLVAMYVAPRARRRGVGEALVRAALAEAGAQGWPAVALQVTSSNVGARRLYEQLGFRATGTTTPHRRRDDLHEVAMECHLGPPGDARTPPVAH